MTGAIITIISSTRMVRIGNRNIVAATNNSLLLSEG